MNFHTLLQVYVFLDFRFYPLNGFFMPIKRVDYRYFQAMQVLRIPILVLNLRIQRPRNSEPLNYPSLGHKR